MANAGELPGRGNGAAAPEPWKPAGRCLFFPWVVFGRWMVDLRLRLEDTPSVEVFCLRAPGEFDFITRSP